MNIFVLDEDPRKCAKYHCDKHVVKMILETAQILSTCIRIHVKEELIVENDVYRPTHKNHPCTLWAGENFHNFEWLVDLGLELCKEYTYRYGKTHSSKRIIEAASLYARLFPQSSGRTPFVQCMPYNYTIPDNPVEAYRNYYIYEKRDMACWTKRKVPDWYKQKVKI